MLSILQRQAKQLEKELKDKQKECLKLQHTTSDLYDQVKTKDIRIETLEIELARLVAIQKAQQEVPTETKKEIQCEETESVVDLSAIISELTSKFETCKSELVFAELRTSVLKLQQATKDLVHIGDLQKIETALSDANTEISLFRKNDKKLQRRLETSELELAQIKDDLKRRDEEIEFLLQVHDASRGYDWTNNQTPPISQPPSFAAGSGGNAIAALSSSSQLSIYQQDANSVNFLVELGATTETAIEVLQATNGDVDRAALMLLP